MIAERTVDDSERGEADLKADKAHGLAKANKLSIRDIIRMLEDIAGFQAVPCAANQMFRLFIEVRCDMVSS